MDYGAHSRLVTLVDMVSGLETFGGRYISAACFADDVAEVLSLAGRTGRRIDEELLRPVRPGHFEFEFDIGQSPFTMHVRKPGIVEIERGHGVESFEDKCPVPILAVKKAEAVKEGLVDETFLLLKGPPIKNDGGGDMPRWCFLLHRRRGGWEHYDGGLVRWVKRALWPEVS